MIKIYDETLMQKLILKILLPVLFILATARPYFAETLIDSVITAKGDEQGLETDYKFELKRDREAVSKAEHGWWKSSMKTRNERLDWFKEDKFGCFIHWGVYSVPGGVWEGNEIHGYAEHLMRIEKIPLNVYKEKLVKTFNPVDFNADEWMKRVKETGMKYFIITAKHHDGFAMFYSNAYPYDIRLTKFHKDPMKELRKAAKKYGIKFGFYYSHAFDWEDPNAPGNDWDYDNPGGDKLLYGRDWWLKDTDFIAKADKYVTEKAIPQIEELIKNYKPDILWFDTPQKLPLFENIRILKAIRKIAPDIVVNGRLARFDDFNFGDYIDTGDRAAYFHPVKGPWESIPTTNNSYGYNKVDTYHKPAGYFIRLLASAAARGGNILLNVGPMGNGKWDPADIQIFKGIGRWMKINGESIYGTSASPLPIQYWGEVTSKPGCLYLHVFNWPDDGKLIVGGLNARIKKIFLLSDESMKPMNYRMINSEDLSIDIPATAPDTVNTVICVKFSGNIKNDSFRLLAPGPYVNKLMVFDGVLHGKGLSYGDGKPDREYITGWKNNRQWISWKCRLNEPAEFKISLGYITAAKNDSGTVFIKIDSKEFSVKYGPVSQSRGSILAEAGDVKLSAGEHIIQIVAGKFNGSELLRPLYVKLVPVR